MRSGGRSGELRAHRSAPRRRRGDGERSGVSLAASGKQWRTPSQVMARLSAASTGEGEAKAPREQGERGEPGDAWTAGQGRCAWRAR